MYLSSIEVIGFKSFAHRVNLKFDSGVTAIVGPNGCGKTNIVDAIRWALGEQRYSTLRSDKMEDVIFNGTKSRKPLGLAEVSLTIQNTKGILPTEYTEVTVTRRVFRSGESEYMLNKVPCRLKDILDLFMDTGMGADAYSVIELKMVETILSDKTDERRRLFEEAAGVTKYKHRRKAAYRKLEDVQQDLVRVNDIVKEVQKTASSLERQAKKAEQYNDVSIRLRTMEIDLLEREYAYQNSKLLPLEQKFALARNDRNAIDEEIRAEERQLDQLREELGTIEGQLEEAQETLTRELDRVHRQEEKILIANERKNSLAANIERYAKEKDDLHVQQGKLEQEQTTLGARQEQLVREIEELKVHYERSRTELDTVRSQAETKKTEVETLNTTLLDLAHTIVDKRGECDRLKARIDNLTGRDERSKEEIGLYEEDIRTNEERIAALTANDRDLRKHFVEAEMHLYNQENLKKKLQEETEGLSKRSVELKGEIERRAEKIDFLRGLIETNEGYADGAKYLLASERWGRKRLTTVADILEVPEKYRMAIEAAIGEFATHLIMQRAQDALAAIGELKKEDRGKATFICLERIPRLARRRRKAHRLGLPATSVVKSDSRYREIVNLLLGDTIIVERFEEAPEILQGSVGKKCVTLDGQILSSTGVLRGGSQRFEESGRIGKTSQIETIEEEIERLRHDLENVRADLKAKHDSYEALDIRPFRNDVKGVEKEMTGIEMQIAQLEFEKKRANDGIERNRQEQQVVSLERDELQHQYLIETRELAQVEQSKGSFERQLDVSQPQLEHLEVECGEKTKLVNDLEIKVVQARSEMHNVGRDIERAQLTLRSNAETLQRREEEILSARDEIARLTSEVTGRTEELETLQTSLRRLEESKQTVEKLHTEKRNVLHAIELKIKDERRLHDDSVTATHDLEMKIAELKSTMEHLRDRAREEFELELTLKVYPENEWVDFAQLREEVKHLKERLHVLGAINFAAFDEFKTESERLSFLTQQRDDLTEAEKTLLDTIEEINNTAQRKFLETFAKIRDNFIRTFKELFQPGDECDLKLEENVDPLEATIEITAKPRGKRPTSIDLLSGGEKTLTAIALLFAIYLVKPSPFCILDEVDAPLDDSNIDRYTRILKKFSDNTQFIVVTHNKRTMEAAQALYGVTMEEEGVSKIVTVRFNEEARVQSATVATGT